MAATAAIRFPISSSRLEPEDDLESTRRFPLNFRSGLRSVRELALSFLKRAAAGVMRWRFVFAQADSRQAGKQASRQTGIYMIKANYCPHDSWNDLIVS